MPSFGSFETDREVYSDPIYTVYTARKAGEPGTDYAVKVFSIERGGLEAGTATDLEELFGDIERSRLDGIGVQERGAAASAFVAPVLDKGQDERGVWYVTRYYPRSVNKIISGRVALSREALQHVIAAISQGALDLKRVCGRSHGDILPSNVQISKSEKLREAEVVLSDPLPGGEGEAAVYELSDLRGVGRILLQLIRQRAIGKEEDFLILPILSTPEWTRLFGKDTEAWLALCNRLLDPNLSLEQLTLEQLVAELKGLEPKAKVSPKLLIGVAAALVLLGIGAFVLSRFTGYRTVEITSDPPGATILMDRQEQASKAPLKLKLKNGTYVIEARHAGYGLAPQTTNLMVQSGMSGKVKFQFLYGDVQIQSDPPGATIIRDGATIGETPRSGEPFVIKYVPAGTEVKYRLELDQHEPTDLSGKVTTGPLALKGKLRARGANEEMVEFESDPTGAKIMLPGNVVIDAPARKYLPVGTHKATAKYRDWPVKDVTLEIKKGAPDNRVSVYFDHGTVTLQSDPDGASVWSGTNQVGVTPVRNLAWRPGPATFRFELAGYETNTATVLVADKGTYRPASAVLKMVAGFVELISDPPGAEIRDQNNKLVATTDTQGAARVPLPPGTYVLKAAYGDLTPVEKGNLTVQAGRPTAGGLFKLEYGTVVFAGIQPADALDNLSIQRAGGRPVKVGETILQKPNAAVNYEIVAAGYERVVTNVMVSVSEKKPISLLLARKTVAVKLISEPPGARFFTGSGDEIRGAGEDYALAWGTVDLVARHGRLDPVTNSAVAVKLEGPNPPQSFKFTYGTLMITNLPPDVAIYEVMPNNQELFVAATASNKFSFEKPTRHTYMLKGRFNSETIITNITRGLNFLISSLGANEWVNSAGMSLVWIDGLPGTPKDKGGWVGKYEVKQKEYQDVMGDNPSFHKLGNDYPVENMNWDQAADFCGKLTARDKAKGVGRGEYRLATQQQWLFFAKDTNDKDSVLSTGAMAPVGSKAPNPRGLYDVRGNVWEYLADTDGTNAPYIGAANNTRMAQSLVFGRVDSRKRTSPDPNVGFRVVLIPNP